MKSLSELNDDELWSYLYHVWDINNRMQLSNRFNIDLQTIYSQLPITFEHDFDFLINITETGRELLIQKIHEKLSSEIYLLFSLRSNPNYEIQEELECIAHRYHLG